MQRIDAAVLQRSAKVGRLISKAEFVRQLLEAGLDREERGEDAKADSKR